MELGHWIIVTNIGVIITVIGLAIRLTWFLAKMDSRIDQKAEKSALQVVDNKADRAHERLDEIKKVVSKNAH